MSYVVVSIICVFALMIGIIGMVENELFSKRRKRRFIVLASIIIFEIIINTISLEIDGVSTELTFFYRFLKIVEFILVPIIPMLLVRQVAHKTFWHKIKKCFLGLVFTNGVLQLVTFFLPLMFKIDENAVYYSTPGTFIYIFILIICFAALLMVSAKNTFTQNTSKYGCTLLLINAFFLFGMTMKLIYPNTNSDWLCITIGFFVFVFYFSNSYLKVDATTSLLNQRAFWNNLANIKYSTAIIVIDANNFKVINDTYGHQSGDLALAKIAELIFSTYSKVGYCYRIGGDEFCVILKPEMLKKLTFETDNCDTYKMLKNLMGSLDKQLALIAKRHPMLKYGVSQGFGIYYSALDNPSLEEYKTIEEVFKIADERMYRRKKASKEKWSERSGFN